MMAGHGGKSACADYDITAVRELLKDFALCYECTTCSSVCPAFQTDSEKNPRVLFTSLVHKPENNAAIIESAWWCCACYSCEVYCPQGVPLTSLFYALKQLSFKANLALPSTVRKAFELQMTGYGFAYSAQTLVKRKALGLPDLLKPDNDEIRGLITSLQKKGQKKV